MGHLVQLLQLVLAIWANIMKHNQNTDNATYITFLVCCQIVCFGDSIQMLWVLEFLARMQI